MNKWCPKPQTNICQHFINIFYKRGKEPIIYDLLSMFNHKNFNALEYLNNLLYIGRPEYIPNDLLPHRFLDVKSRTSKILIRSR